MCAAVCLVEARDLQSRATVGFRRGRHARLPSRLFQHSARRRRRVESNADAIRNLIFPDAQWQVPLPSLEDIPGLPELDVPSVQDINKFVLNQLDDFLKSSQGVALANQLNHEMDAGSLMIPVTIMEELFRQRMRQILSSTLRHHALNYLRFFSVRAAAASVILHGIKAGFKWLARRGGKRTAATVDFVCEVVFPSSFFGPVSGILIGVLQLLGWGRITPPSPPSSSEVPSVHSEGQA